MWHFIVSFEAVPTDRDVVLAAIDADGVHDLAFRCRRNYRCWIIVETGHSVDVNPTHWREWSSDGPSLSN